VVCHRGDGWGIAELKRRGLPVMVLSTETNPVVARRCEKLGLPYRQGFREKLPVLQAWLAELGLNPAEVVYLGNDLNDLGCLGYVGCGAAVADAHPQVLAAARLKLANRGGEGAIRELAELVTQKVK
jgi:N-acylneuraminate cytidylyltransferase